MATKPKVDGKEEKPKTTPELLKSEQDARKAWYALFDGAPVKPYNKDQSAALRSLEKAKSALVAATGKGNFREAAASLDYKPQYAPRTRKVAVAADAKKS